MITRREVLELAAGTLVIAGCGGDGGVDLELGDDASFDDVLDRLHRTDPLTISLLSNHGPMAIEALVALGRDDRLVPWVRGYESKLFELIGAAPLPESERAGALGALERRAEWIAAYEAEVFDVEPAELIARDWPTLVAGYPSIHGVLRTAHAARSLERADTPSRRRELAHALGYWAADFTPLAGEPGAAARAGNDVVTALAAVPMLPDELRGSGNIIDGISGVDDFPDFAAAVAAVDLDAMPVAEAIGELAAAAARLLVARGGPEATLAGISYLHGVTGTSALRLLLPALDGAAQRAGLGRAFQFVAAVHSAFGDAPGVPDQVEATTMSAAEIAERAAEDDDEHAIKLSEAALREHAIDPRPELLAVAAGLFS